MYDPDDIEDSDIDEAELINFFMNPNDSSRQDDGQDHDEDNANDENEREDSSEEYDSSVEYVHVLDQDFPTGRRLNVGEDIKMKYDVDSIVVAMKNLYPETAAEFADSIMGEESQLVIPSYIFRTNTTSQSRLKLQFRKNDEYLKFFQYKGSKPHYLDSVKLENAPNVCLFRVAQGAFDLHVHFVLIGGGYLNTSYLTNQNFAVLVSAMRLVSTLSTLIKQNKSEGNNYTEELKQIYPFSHAVDESEVTRRSENDEDCLNFNELTVEALDEFIDACSAQSEIQGISTSNRKSTDWLKLSSEVHFQGSLFGRIFIRVFLSILENPKPVIDLVYKYHELDAGSEKFHKINLPDNEKLTEVITNNNEEDGSFLKTDEFVNTAKLLHRKGILYAHAAGTKNKIRFGSSSTFKIDHANNARTNDFIQDGFVQGALKVREYINPTYHKEREEEKIESGSLSPMLHRVEISSDKIVRVFDVGINYQLSSANSEILLPSGPMALMVQKYIMEKARNNTRIGYNSNATQNVLNKFHDKFGHEFTLKIIDAGGIEKSDFFDQNGNLIYHESDHLQFGDREMVEAELENQFKLLNLVSTERLYPNGERDEEDEELKEIRHSFGHKLLNNFCKPSNFGIYPILGTLGSLGNTHTGKFM